jgi:hypothetical protein
MLTSLVERFDIQKRNADGLGLTQSRELSVVNHFNHLNFSPPFNNMCMETQRAKPKNTKHDCLLSVETQSVTNIQVIRDEMQCGKQLEKFREPTLSLT